MRLLVKLTQVIAIAVYSAMAAGLFWAAYDILAITLSVE